ncbi:hypothetical protein BOX15_Mlig026026g3 [Macrostomum lignano]|uniref:Phospholipid scramblase n=1 Tax=Macrostomum lignano TaxID=282301 RepID=A0A267DGV7_9PLAT|nr:hypothetical protein BOX15_Mlig026026g3 [Macrostomum lignano]
MDRLAALEKIQVKQKVELIEAVTGFETNNEYEIKDGAGVTFLRAKESTGLCGRMCCGAHRAFTINITDPNGRNVIRVVRDYKCFFIGQCCSCCSCCRDSVTVEAPQGNIVGFVLQQCSACNANFTIRDSHGMVVLHLKGPCYCGCRCPGQKYTFRMMSSDETHEVGRLHKEWAGFAKEILTDADTFLLEVPQDMAVETKATLVAAVLLIDFMFFEDNSGKNKVASTHHH